MSLLPFIPITSLSCLIACSLVVCLLGCGAKDEPSAKKTKSRVTIFATCDTQGWIEPCGCASGQSGGLSRRATLIDQLAGSGDRLLVSVGGAALGDQPYDAQKFNAIIAGEELMGYQIHNLGASELRLPIPESESITFVSTNIAKPLSPIKSSVIISKGGWKILVLGVVSPKLVGSNIKVESPERSILKAIERQDKPHDCVVVLAYMGQDELKELAANVPEVDVIIGGKTEQGIAPKYFGRTLLTAVANKGKFVARVEAKPNGSGLGWKADLHEVTSEFEEDASQQANLKSFRKRLDGLDLSARETSYVPTESTDANQFAGSDTCQSCHQEDFKIWKQSTHAHAWKTLEDVGAHVDSSCQRCHSVGFGYDSGFMDRKTSMNRVDVGCESCHGPSSQHVADENIRTPWLAADSCLACHDHENSPHFEYDSYWQQVEHGNTESYDAK